MAPNPTSQPTCWTLIQAAAGGSKHDRSEFSRRYLPVVRAVFAARWHRTPLRDFVDDAVQETFLECFRAEGALSKAEPGQAGGFRAYLSGVVANVARRVERRRARQWARKADGSFHPEELTAVGGEPAELFDRAWAVALVREAGALHEQRAAAADDGARRRVELLHLRFHEGLPIRAIAARWQQEPAAVHTAYRRARREYRACLREVIVFHHPGAEDEVDRECERLLALLG